MLTLDQRIVVAERNLHRVRIAEAYTRDKTERITASVRVICARRDLSKLLWQRYQRDRQAAAH